MNPQTWAPIPFRRPRTGTADLRAVRDGGGPRPGDRVAVAFDRVRGRTADVARRGRRRLRRAAGRDRPGPDHARHLLRGGEPGAGHLRHRVGRRAGHRTRRRRRRRAPRPRPATGAPPTGTPHDPTRTGTRPPPLTPNCSWTRSAPRTPSNVAVTPSGGRTPPGQRSTRPIRRCWPHDRRPTRQPSQRAAAAARCVRELDDAGRAGIETRNLAQPATAAGTPQAVTAGANPLGLRTFGNATGAAPAAGIDNGTPTTDGTGAALAGALAGATPADRQRPGPAWPAPPWPAPSWPPPPPAWSSARPGSRRRRRRLRPFPATASRCGAMRWTGSAASTRSPTTRTGGGNGNRAG